MNSSLKNKCISFSKMSIADTIPIISSCQSYIGNDTGWAQISAALNLKSLFLFCDSPSEAYGTWRNNIEIIYIKSYYFQLNMVIPEWYNMVKKRYIKY